MILSRVVQVLLIGVLVHAVALAQLKFEPELVDLGKQKQHQQIERVVTVTNTSGAPLDILRMISDCGCTAGMPAELRLAPGASTTMKVHTDTRTFQGLIERRITLQTTMGDFSVPVRMQVSAFEDWTVSPLPVIMPPSMKDQAARNTVLLTYTGNAGTTAIEAKSNLPWLEAQLTVGERAGDYLLHLHKPAAAAPSGNLSAIVIVKTSDPAQSLISIPVYIPVHSGVRVAPNPIILPTTKAGQESRGYFRVMGWTGQNAPLAKMGSGEVVPAGELNGEFTFEVSVRPEREGALTQMVQLYDGAKLEVEVPMVVRAEPAVTVPAEKAPPR